MLNKLREILGVAPKDEPQDIAARRGEQNLAAAKSRRDRGIDAAALRGELMGAQARLSRAPLNNTYQNAGNILTDGYLENARYEDEGFSGNPRNINQYSPLNTGIKNFVGMANFSARPELISQANQSNPMDFDTVPNNYTDGRTGYYQGSNPYLNNINSFEQKLRVR